MSDTALPQHGALGPAQSLRLAVVGPSHPLKGGVAAHTTTLAHELSAAGHEVTLVSWAHLYPTWLYPGEQAVPGGEPDVPPFRKTVRPLSWARPDTWVRTGRRLRGLDAVLVVHVVPPVVPAHLALLRAAGALRPGVGALRPAAGAPRPAAGDPGGHPGSHSGPRSIVIAHNVLPHEPRPGDRQLVQALVRRVDALVVHSAGEARLARELGAGYVRELELPPHLPGGGPQPHVAGSGRTRLLCLGIVRDYKGVDLLLEAAREVPDVELTIAGELWGQAGERVRRLAQETALSGRVEVRDGYVPADRIAGLMARSDILALTYRSATASQNVLLAQRHGLPVLASDVGTFGRQVRDGVDGVLVPPDDHAALVAALRRLADPAQLARLRAAVPEPDLTGPWARYVGAIEALAGDASIATEGDARDADAASGSAGWARSTASRALSRTVSFGAGIRGRVRTRRLVEVRPTDFPEWVRACDVLAIDTDAVAARSLARTLGLPRCPDAVAAWAALGALAAILRIRDDGRRRSLLVDASGRRSPMSRWSRAVGFEPLELAGDEPGRDLESLDVDTASLDVITRIHPGGCSAHDVDDTIVQASWALRSGGLLIVTLPVGEGDPQWSVSPADVRGVLARAGDRGLVLVGDVDGDITDRMRRAARVARDTRGDRPADTDSPAYGIIRLTFRRR